MRQDIREFVRSRAADRCEYCLLHDEDSPAVSHQVEHVIPRKHGGTDELDNLALACIACNLYKGPNLSGIDPVTGELTPLFHPRRDGWNQHFAVDRLDIIGLTAIGRTTIVVLRLNDPVHLRLRISTNLK